RIGRSPRVGTARAAGARAISSSVSVATLARSPWTLTGWGVSVRIPRRLPIPRPGGLTMRILGCSAVLGTLFTLTLAACGGGGTPTPETPKPQTATTAAPAPAPTQAPPGTPPTTTAGAKTGEDEDMASPLLAWADSDTDEGKAPLSIQFKADIEGG